MRFDKILQFFNTQNIIARYVENVTKFCQRVKRGENILRHIFGYGLGRHADLARDFLLFHTAVAYNLSQPFILF